MNKLFLTIKRAVVLLVSVLTVSACGGGGSTNEQSSSSMNAPLVASSLSFTLHEDSSIASSFDELTVSKESFSFKVESLPNNGTVNINGDGFEYIPSQDFNGEDSFTYELHLGERRSNVATISFNIKAVNDTPVALSQSLALEAGTAMSVDLVATDIDGDSLSYEIKSGFMKASINENNIADGTLEIIAPYGTYGSDELTFTANDGIDSSKTQKIELEIEVPQTIAKAINYHYQAVGQVRLHAVLIDDDNKTIVFGDTKGQIGNMADVVTNELNFFSVHNEANELEKIVEFRFENGYSPILTSYLTLHEGGVSIIGTNHEDPSLFAFVSLNEDYEVEFSKTFYLPHVMAGKSKLYSVSAVDEIGFYILGNDHRLYWIDFDGELRSSSRFDVDVEHGVARWSVKDVRIVNGLVYMAGSYLACDSADPSSCSFATGIESFLLKTDLQGNVIDLETSLLPNVGDTRILSDGSVVYEIMQGNINYSRSVGVALFNSNNDEVWRREDTNHHLAQILVTENDDVLWWRGNRRDWIVTRISVENETLWQTTTQYDTSTALLLQNKFVGDKYGNLYISFMEEQIVSGVSTRGGFLHIAHVDYAGNLQWIKQHEPSTLSSTFEIARRTAIGDSGKIVLISHDAFEYSDQVRNHGAFLLVTDIEKSTANE